MTPIEAKSPRVALLIADGPLGKCVANRLSERFPELTVIQEEPEGKWDVVRRRARHCGWSAALGQAAFGLVYKLGNRKHEHRRQKILSGSGLSPTLRPDLDVHRVPSINADGCEALLKNLKPDVVAVYGTRLIKPRLLQSFSVPFLNYHAGITPMYRGQHPAYWALVNRERAERRSYDSCCRLRRRYRTCALPGTGSLLQGRQHMDLSVGATLRRASALRKIDHAHPRWPQRNKSHGLALRASLSADAVDVRLEWADKTCVVKKDRKEDFYDGDLPVRKLPLPRQSTLRRR